MDDAAAVLLHRRERLPERLAVVRHVVAVSTEVAQLEYPFRPGRGDANGDRRAAAPPHGPPVAVVDPHLVRSRDEVTGQCGKEGVAVEPVETQGRDPSVSRTQRDAGTLRHPAFRKEVAADDLDDRAGGSLIRVEPGKQPSGLDPLHPRAPKQVPHSIHLDLEDARSQPAG